MADNDDYYTTAALLFVGAVASVFVVMSVLAEFVDDVQRTASVPHPVSYPLELLRDANDSLRLLVVAAVAGGDDDNNNNNKRLKNLALLDTALTRDVSIPPEFIPLTGGDVVYQCKGVPFLRSVAATSPVGMCTIDFRRGELRACHRRPKDLHIVGSLLYGTPIRAAAAPVFAMRLGFVTDYGKNSGNEQSYHLAHCIVDTGVSGIVIGQQWASTPFFAALARGPAISIELSLEGTAVKARRLGYDNSSLCATVGGALGKKLPQRPTPNVMIVVSGARADGSSVLNRADMDALVGLEFLTTHFHSLTLDYNQGVLYGDPNFSP